MNIFTSQGAFSTLQKLENRGQNSFTDHVKESDTTSGFSDFMRSALESYGKEMISEEDLFAVLIEQRLGEMSEEASGMYAMELEKEKNAIRRADGYVNLEKAAVRALRSVVESGLIEKAEGERVYSESFMGAQLDDNLDELWDDRGSENDPTIAVAPLEEALMKAEMFVNGLNAGEIEVAQRSMRTGSTGEASVGRPLAHAGSSSVTGSSHTAASDGMVRPQSMDGPGGFLWKPVSESDRNLVVLLPEALRGMINKVEIHSSLPPSEITKLADGRFAGDTMNGDRPHFRFDRPGSAYGQDVHVVAYQDDGTMLSWNIRDGGSRQE
jgi:hypothetical protein